VHEWGTDEVVLWCTDKKLRLTEDVIVDQVIGGEILLTITDEDLKELDVKPALQRRRILMEVSKLKVALAATTIAAPAPLETSKFIGAKLRVGKAEEAAAGLSPLLRVCSATIGAYLLNPMEAIQTEIGMSGTASDKNNLRKVLTGGFQYQNVHLTVEDLVQHDSAVAAKLAYHHVVALRLYTSPFFDSINAPLRAEPLQRPHPFAATVYFITQAINLLRQVDAKKPDRNEPRVYWRGCRDLAVGDSFLSDGGTEIACMSASADREVAVGFAKSKCPLVFKIETDNFMSRGANVSFLSVYPNEREVLYPPLTYLHPVGSEEETIGDTAAHIVRVRPTLGTV
jgi:hypothetical protein